MSTAKTLFRLLRKNNKQYLLFILLQNAENKYVSIFIFEILLKKDLRT